jgi:hypothetical protein
MSHQAVKDGPNIRNKYCAVHTQIRTQIHTHTLTCIAHTLQTVIGWPGLNNNNALAVLALARSLDLLSGQERPPLTRVGQNRIYTPFMTVHLVISLPEITCFTPYVYSYSQPYL